MWALESYDGFSVLRWEEKLQPHYNPLDIHVTGCHVTLPPLDDGGGKGEQRLAGKHKNGKKGTLCSTAPARGPPPQSSAPARTLAFHLPRSGNATVFTGLSPILLRCPVL